VTLRSDRLELRRLDGGDAAFVKSLYANAQVTRTLLRIQGPISIEEAREFCQVPAAACGDHRFGAALQTDGNLIALGSVRKHTELPGLATIGYSVLLGTPCSPRSGVRASVPSWLPYWSSSPPASSAPLKFARRLWTTIPRPRVFLRNLASQSWRRAHPKSTRAVTNAASRDGSVAAASRAVGGRRTTGLNGPARRRPLSLSVIQSCGYVLRL
jgi:hypothetical protein